MQVQIAFKQEKCPCHSCVDTDTDECEDCEEWYEWQKTQGMLRTLEGILDQIEIRIALQGD